MQFIVPWPPGDLEDVLTRMIAEEFQKTYGKPAAVVNKPGGGTGPFPERMGEIGKAFVVPKSGATFITDEFVFWCRQQMANYKVPRQVQIVAALRRRPTRRLGGSTAAMPLCPPRCPSTHRAAHNPRR